MPGLLALVSKINQLNFVHISVSSQADAFTLFETLNNRGVPLSAIDIIKNKMLAEMEKQHKVKIDESYERWQEIIGAVPDATDQERFLQAFLQRISLGSLDQGRRDPEGDQVQDHRYLRETHP